MRKLGPKNFSPTTLQYLRKCYGGLRRGLPFSAYAKSGGKKC